MGNSLGLQKALEMDPRMVQRSTQQQVRNLGYPLATWLIMLMSVCLTAFLKELARETVKESMTGYMLVTKKDLRSVGTKEENLGNNLVLQRASKMDPVMEQKFAHRMEHNSGYMLALMTESLQEVARASLKAVQTESMLVKVKVKVKMKEKSRRLVGAKELKSENN